MSATPCAVDGCTNAVRKGGYCWGHYKRKQRRKVVSSPLTFRPGDVERLQESALTYAGAESDEEWRRARDNLRKSAVAARPAILSELIRAALLSLKAKGVKLGRPRKFDPVAVAQMVESVGNISRAAVLLKVSRGVVYRALAAVPKTSDSGTKCR